MSDNLGVLFRITSFGESHGKCVGVVVEGCPAGVNVEADMIQNDLDRRRAKDQVGATPRREADIARVLSGVYQGRTTGAPICMIVENTDTDSQTYSEYMRTPRPGHADYPARIKYGGYSDPRGGGRFSGRITVGFVMAGAVARAALARIGVEVCAHTVGIGGVEAPPCDPKSVRVLSQKDSLGCCDEASSALMGEVIEAAKAQGDSVGGIVECVVLGLPVGMGEPVFAGLEGEIARGIFAIPAVKGVEFGSGFALCRVRGSEGNDPFVVRDGHVVTAKNDSGGILGGMSTGMPVVLRVGFKPTPSISRAQTTVDLDKRTAAELVITGRHDACIVPRAVVVVEAVVACVLCDLALQSGLMPRLII